MKACRKLLPLLLLLTLPSVVHAQFEFVGNTITKYTGPGGAVIIPETINGQPVVSIGNSAFSFRANVTSVFIPHSVTSIGSSPFEGCTGLEAITVDELNSVYSSSDGVLFNKSQTVLVCYPAGKAGNYAVPNTVTTINYIAFSGCSRLVNINVPDSVNSMGTFSSCINLTNATIGDSVVFIVTEAFKDCFSLTSVRIGNGVTNIGKWAFEHCSKLTNLTISDSVHGLHEPDECYAP